MGNKFVTPEMVARDAAITLEDRLTVGNLVARDKEGLFTAAKVGDSVKVTVPPVIVVVLVKLSVFAQPKTVSVLS